MTNPQLADIGDSFEDILSHLKGINQSYDQMLITAAFLIASAKSEVRSALKDAESQREGRTKAESFTAEIVTGYGHIVALYRVFLAAAEVEIPELLEKLHEDTLKMKRSGQVKGGKERAKRDKSFQEKDKVLGCWVKWQHEKDNYESIAAFARDMLDKSERLSDVKTIGEWCRNWRKVWKEIPIFCRDLKELEGLPDRELSQALLKKNAYILENGTGEVTSMLEKIVAYQQERNRAKMNTWNAGRSK